MNGEDLIKKRFVNYDITLQQMGVLRELNTNEFLSPNEIANYIHCDHPTASVIIKNLEKKDSFIEDETNAKYHKLLISTQGKEILQSINSYFHNLQQPLLIR